MKNHRSFQAVPNRNGFSRIEVVVVIIILLVLFGLIVPKIDQDRGNVYSLQCKNNLRNIAVSVTAYTAANNDKVPLLDDGTYGWSVTLLPYLDQMSLYRELTNKQMNSPIGGLFMQQIDVLTCQGEENKFQKPGSLSYVVNAGYGRFEDLPETGEVVELGTHSPEIDLNGDGTVDVDEREINRATGVFWRSHLDGYRMTFDEIQRGDGMANTLLLTENKNAGSWYSSRTMETAFVIGRNALQFEPDETSRGPLHLKSANLGPFGINASPNGNPGQRPSPSSNHPGTVNAAFCDGRVMGLSEEIDPLIYARLLSPNGEKYGQSRVPEADFY